MCYHLSIYSSFNLVNVNLKLNDSILCIFVGFLVGMQNDKPSPELPAENIAPVTGNPVSIKSFVPKVGLLHHKQTPQLILCKPKLMPLKSVTLEKLQTMQAEAEKKLSNR